MGGTVMRSGLTTRKGSLSFVLGVCALMILSVPTGQAAHGSASSDITVCGEIVNEVGWGIDGISIVAIGRGTKSFDHAPPPADLSGEDGSFSFDMLADRYEIVVEDNRSLDERHWAAYLSERFPVAAHLETTPDTCGAANGVDLGEVTLSAPANGFIELTANDAVADAPLAEASASFTFNGLISAAQVQTGADGTARIACPLGTTVDAMVEKTGYDASSVVSTECENGLSTLDADVWRAGVALTGTVHDETTGGVVQDATVQATASLLDPLPSDHPYVLSATTDASGGYELALPWGDTFTLEASATGYEAADPAFVTPTMDDIDPGIPQDFTLDRSTVTFDGQVVDLAGNGILARLTFSGDTLGTDLVENSPSTGDFSVVLAQGSYDLTIESDEKNTRTCSLDIGETGTITLEPARCLTLLADGTGAVEGTVQDAVTGTGIADVLVDAGSDETTTTDGTGAFAFEVVDGDRTITFNEAGFDELQSSASVPLDGFVDLGTLSLDRTSQTLTVTVKDGTDGTLIQGATVCAASDDAGLTSEACSDPTGTDGATSVEVLWSRLAPDELDAGDYKLTGERDDAAPLYDLAVCLTGLDIEPGGASVTCELSPADEGVITVGPIVDAHTSKAIEGAIVEAESDDLPESACAAPYNCEALTGTNGIATLTLPDDTRRYTVTVSHDDYIDPDSPTDVAVDTTLLSEAALARVASTIEVLVLDAHTGFQVSGAELVATGQGFTCDPDAGTFTCEASTDANGTAQLTLPWGGLDITSLAGTYDEPQGSGILASSTETDVNFLEAAGAVTLAAPSTAATNDDDAELHLLRAPATPITGTVVDNDAVPVEAATITPEIEGLPFTCQPTDHDATTAPDYGCDGVTTDTTGAYALALPHATDEPYTWTLRANHADPASAYEEQAEGIDDGDVVDFTLWPTQFDLTVLALDASDGEIIPFATVCIANLDQRLDNPLPVRDQVCQNDAGSAEPIVFEDVGWLRDGPGDTTDRFLVTASAADRIPEVAILELGPNQDQATMRMLPLLQSCFPVYYTHECKLVGGPADSDGDGWTDTQENLLGTDPEDASDPGAPGPNDADFDLVPDEVEDELCLRPATQAVLNAIPAQAAGRCEERADGSWDYVPPPPLPPEPLI